jgi:large subunit ribosomal protein L23
MNSLDIIIKPVFTEKSSADSSLGKYHFWVLPKATKKQVKAAVENIYGVQVQSVNTNKYNNRKEKKRGYKIYKLGTNYKKAIVKLVQGQQIEALSKSEK